MSCCCIAKIGPEVVLWSCARERHVCDAANRTLQDTDIRCQNFAQARPMRLVLPYSNKATKPCAHKQHANPDDATLYEEVKRRGREM